MKFNWSHITLSIACIAVVAIWVTSFVSSQNKEVEKIHYYVESVEGARNLITVKEIQKKISDRYDLDAGKIKITKLDLPALESSISNDNRILKTETYLDAQRHLHINVIQRRPIVRIIDEKGKQYYLDQEGEFISKQDYKAIRVPVATGNIEPFNPDWKTQKTSKINQCFTIIQALRKEEFYTSLIEQIHFEEDQIKLVPKIGEEVIVINDLNDIDRKLYNLKRFYETEMTLGNAWGKYDELDISIKNQVVPRTTKP